VFLAFPHTGGLVNSGYLPSKKQQYASQAYSIAGNKNASHRMHFFLTDPEGGKIEYIT